VTASAVLFDLDGLLVDSEPVWYDVEYAVVDELGGGWTHAHQAACVGGTLDQSCRYILELTGSALPVEVLQDKLLTSMVSRFRERLPVRDGAVALLDGLAAAGTPIGLVSSSYRVLVDAALDALGRERFTVTVAGDEVARGKPDPEPYLTACRRLGVEPERTVVLEDAPNGVMSAEAAGCRVVAMPEVAAVEETPTRPVVRSLLDVTPAWLLDLV
jgi:HAD superfamily hydrolase (TIGR01509 family)